MGNMQAKPRGWFTVQSLDCLGIGRTGRVFARVSTGFLPPGDRLPGAFANFRPDCRQHELKPSSHWVYDSGR